MIKLTEKQKAALTKLNDDKIKLESDYAALQQKISEVLEFIFDANGVDTKDIEKVGIEGEHIVYTKKAQEAEVSEAPAAEMSAS